MSISTEFKGLLLAKIDLVDLIGKQITLQKKSNNYFARCPFHDEKSASFSVSPEKQFYHCFGCGAHGNAIDFLMEHDRLSFPEAIQMLAQLANIEIPRDHTFKKPEDHAPYDLMEKIKFYYHHQLKQSPTAIEYLKKRRITGSIAQQFGLGYAVTNWDHLLNQFGSTETDRKKLCDLGMLVKKQEPGYYDRFRDRIMFPIEDHRGRIIGFGGRVLNQTEPKYLNSPETVLFQKGHELYGLYQVLKAQRHIQQILVVEGYMDVIALFQHGITYAVATLGTATTSHHLHRLMRYTTNITFCFDGDRAGREAAWRALQVALPYLHDQLQIRFLFLPEKEDPDSLIHQEGKIAFEARLQTAVSLSDFFFQRLIDQTGEQRSMEGRARLIYQALKLIKQVSPGIFQHLLLDELSKRARIDKNELQIQLQRDNSPPVEKSVSTSASSILPKYPPPIHLALALLIQYPRLVKHFDLFLPDSTLLGYAFLRQLVQIINKNTQATTAMLLEYWRDRPEMAFISELAHFEHHIPEAAIDNAFKGCLKQIILLTYDDTINALLKKANQIELSLEQKQELVNLINKKKAFMLS